LGIEDSGFNIWGEYHIIKSLNQEKEETLVDQKINGFTKAVEPMRSQLQPNL
jgi:hypothetical protein